MRNTCPGVRTADQFSSGAITTSCTTLFSTMASLQAGAAGAAINRRPCDLEVRLQTLCRLQTKFHRVAARPRRAPVTRGATRCYVFDGASCELRDRGTLASTPPTSGERAQPLG